MFRWITNVSSGIRGSIGEELVQDLCGWADIPVGPRRGAGHDMVVGNSKVEVKLSTLWKGGTYCFQQIRRDDYDHVVFVGLSPDDRVHMWVVPKCVMEEHVLEVLGQHGGAKATETAWVRVDPNAPPSWLKPYGISVCDAVDALAKL